MDARGRWAALFAAEDDEAAREAADLDHEVRDLTRHAIGRVPLVDRLVAAVGAEVVVTTAAGTVRGPLTDAAPAWLLVGETLVPTTAVVAVEGLTGRAEQPGPVRRRLSLGYALRALARTPVAVTLTTGETVHGDVGDVGADFIEVGSRAVPYAAIAAVRPAG